jgi:hypothetical protein
MDLGLTHELLGVAFYVATSCSQLPAQRLD